MIKHSLILTAAVIVEPGKFKRLIHSSCDVQVKEELICMREVAELNCGYEIICMRKLMPCKIIQYV